MPIHPATFLLWGGSPGYWHYDGTTWTQRSPQLVDFVATSTVVYAVSDISQYLYRSLDGGASFAQIGTATGANLTGIARLRSGRIFVKSGELMKFTDDEGATWHPVPLPPEVIQVRTRSIFTTRQDVILIATATTVGRPLYRSADQGATWQRVTPDINVPFTECVFETRAGTLLVLRSAHGFSGYQDIMRSTDQGVTWQVVYSENTPGDAWGDIGFHIRQKIVQLASGRLVAIRPRIAGWADGYISDDDGLTWTPTGPNTRGGYGMVYNARSATWYWGGGSDVDQLLQSTDEGATWQSTGIFGALWSGTGLGPDEVVTPDPRSLRLSTVPGVAHDSPSWGKEVLPQWRWSKDVIA
jgi:hypothetical protein